MINQAELGNIYGVSKDCDGSNFNTKYKFEKTYFFLDISHTLHLIKKWRLLKSFPDTINFLIELNPMKGTA